MPMVLLKNLLSQSRNILQKTCFSSDSVLQYSFHIGIFYLFEASRSPLKGLGGRVVAGGLRWTTTASPPDALHLGQSRLVNNPGMGI